MTDERQPSYDAVYAVIRERKTDVYTNAIIWKAVEAALNAIGGDAAEDWRFRQVPGTDANVFIQWKGTDVCMDVTCPCGANGHVDAGFAYSLKCADCGRVFDVGCAVAVRVVEEPQGEPIIIGEAG